jgi:hypothetical protein
MSEPFKEGYLALDEKCEFLIETLEHFIDIDELAKRFTEQARKNAEFMNLEMTDFTFSKGETWSVLISHLAVRLAIRKNVSPFDLSKALNGAMSILYSVDINDKLKKIYNGTEDRDEGDPADEYRS